jgi:hypothetical protein
VVAASARRLSLRLSNPAFFLPALLLLSLGVSAWHVDARLPTPDEGALLTAAAKIRRGAVFYKDLDAYLFPGAHYLLALGMTFFGEHLTVARWMAALCFSGIVACLYAAALQLMERRWAALFGLSLLSFKFLAWPAFSAYLYSDFAFLGASAAIAALVGYRFQGPSPRLWLAGLGIGVAFVCKQNVGIYLGAASGAALLFPRLVMGLRGGPLRQRLREVALLGVGVAAGLSPLLVYFAAHGVLGRMLYSGLIRPLTRYLPTSGIPFSPALAWWRLGEIRGDEASPYFVDLYWHMLQQQQLPAPDAYPIYWLAGELFSRLLYTSVPFAFGWVLLRRFRGGSGPDPRTARGSLLGLLAAAVVWSAFPRADAFHILSVYPLVALLLFALVARDESRPRTSWPLRATAVAVALLLALCTVLTASYRARLSYQVQLPRAEVWVDPSEAWIQPLVEQISQEVPPDERIFVYGHESHFYFLIGRFYPWPYSQLYPGQEGGDGGLMLSILLKRVPPRLVLRGVLSWPGVPALPDYAPQLFDYLWGHFETDKNFFVEHPVPAGETPPDWVISVMRPKPTQPAEPTAPAAR